ncbi:putative pentatricopeptide repeat-containing protein At1g77010, mitochondrial [Vitis riparia]|uniref:putative pentatricopeptide repeat-containing protein At1g77010, mitochondrial n=1 Tax=Vitis riparia TaxID=96939 RepID=UPI00155A63E9|nr:putative pentatricopeptide repeat-containing protein At1g77010, mitochondrial [Vitis riparia]
MVDLDLHSLARQLGSCNNYGSIYRGRQLHILFLKSGVLHSVLSIGNRLLQMYSRCNSMREAQQLFEEMPKRNCFSWNTMIEGYLKSGSKGKSLELFDSMPHKDAFSWNVVISGFAKEGDLEVARRLFNEMPWKNGIAWNSMIHGYACNGRPKEAVGLFKDLSLNPLERLCGDTFVLATVVGTCTNLGALDCGKQIHARIVVDEVEFDSVLGSSLVNLYGKCGDIDSANHVLNLMKEPDAFSLSALMSGYASCGRMNDARRIFCLKSNACVVLWNSMISGYVANNEALEALELFNNMRRYGVQEDYSTFASVLSACSTLGIIDQGKQVHAHVYKVGFTNDIIIDSALVDMYSKCRRPDDACKVFSDLQAYDTILLNSMITVYSNCGRIDDARQIFATMPSKSLISWNSMIVGFSQNACPIEALDLFCEMNKLGLRMDKFSLAGVISACASISSLELGEQIFARATIIGLEFDQIISTSLVDFYCKCGLVEHGRKLFDRMMKSDEVPWNSMLMGYATNGHGIEALNVFDQMRSVGVQPTDITFVGVLSACDHCGLVEEGRKWFYAMKLDYHINPGIEHYSCMVDLYARAGLLEDAMNLIEQMPFKADASMWSSVLRGCVAHGNNILGKKVAKRIIDLDPENSGAYVQLSGIYATFEDWGRSAQVRKLMYDKKIPKVPGCSWADSLTS